VRAVFVTVSTERTFRVSIHFVGFGRHGCATTGALEDLVRFWPGHSDWTATDGYSKLSEDAEYRREVAEKMAWVSIYEVGRTDLMLDRRLISRTGSFPFLWLYYFLELGSNGWLAIN